MREYLFKIKYIGETTNHFVKGNEYKVIEIDSDGDYVVIDEFLNPISEYKSKFQSQEEKIKVKGNLVKSIFYQTADLLVRKRLYQDCSVFRIIGNQDEDKIPENGHYVSINIKPSDEYKFIMTIGTIKADLLTNYLLIQSNSDIEDLLKIQTQLLKAYEL
ncbi:hypothetical protein [Brassicibacter mesophilus]|uniref:hypothetical protein n=1 Tax=Brassicibacter mesophilus TaxID=745119 RepID=UPI003D235648